MATVKYTCVLLAVVFSVACAYHAPVEPTPVIVPPSNAPASIQILAGSRSSTVLDVSAKVLTADGRFLTDVLVTFTATPGTVYPLQQWTNGNGMAQTVLTTQGTSVVTATVGPMVATISLP